MPLFAHAPAAAFHLQRQVANVGRGLLAHDFNRALEADVLVVVADPAFGRREQRLGKLGGILQARRKLDAAYAARFLVILKARTSQGSRGRCTR